MRDRDSGTGEPYDYELEPYDWIYGCAGCGRRHAVDEDGWVGGEDSCAWARQLNDEKRVRDHDWSDEDDARFSAARDVA